VNVIQFKLCGHSSWCKLIGVVGKAAALLGIAAVVNLFAGLLPSAVGVDAALVMSSANAAEDRIVLSHKTNRDRRHRHNRNRRTRFAVHIGLGHGHWGFGFWPWHSTRWWNPWWNEPVRTKVVVQPPPVYIERSTPTVTVVPDSATSTGQSYWYYCAPKKAYYPYAKKCSEEWMKVLPSTPR